MNVTAGDVPSGSMLGRDVIAGADFWDSYTAPLSHKGLGIVDIFFRIFAHRPWWMKLIMIVRNEIVSFVGLDAPSLKDILRTEIKHDYIVGEKIGGWPVFALTENELVAGRDNKHIDFRISLMKVPDGEKINVTVTTVCWVNNLFGKYYLFCIIPFHKRGLQMLIANAVAAKRL